MNISKDISWLPLIDGNSQTEKYRPFLRSNKDKLRAHGAVGIVDDIPPEDALVENWERVIANLSAMTGPEPYRPGL